ncbi:MAG: hypothetical protein ACOCU8_01120 [Patescibacteria group bacterium]
MSIESRGRWVCVNPDCQSGSEPIWYDELEIGPLCPDCGQKMAFRPYPFH